MSKSDKYKIIKWYNQETREVFFGIDVRMGGEWYHVIDGNPAAPVFFSTEKEAKEWKAKNTHQKL